MFSTEELSARAEIYDCLMRYCRGVDRGDAAIIASVYHPDSIDHHGPWSGSGSDFASYIVGEVDKTGILGQHHITNVLIELADGVAAVESYYWALHPLTEAL